MLREKDVLDSMSHNMIIAAHGSFQDEKRIYLVLEYVPGGDLFGTIDTRNMAGELNDCKLTCNEATFYTACIASCLFHVHQVSSSFALMRGTRQLLSTSEIHTANTCKHERSVESSTGTSKPKTC